jgi:hypothetical protein
MLQQRREQEEREALQRTLLAERRAAEERAKADRLRMMEATKAQPPPSAFVQHLLEVARPKQQTQSHPQPPSQTQGQPKLQPQPRRVPTAANATPAPQRTRELARGQDDYRVLVRSRAPQAGGSAVEFLVHADVLALLNKLYVSLNERSAGTQT